LEQKCARILRASPYKIVLCLSVQRAFFLDFRITQTDPHSDVTTEHHEASNTTIMPDSN